MFLYQNAHSSNDLYLYHQDDENIFYPIHYHNSYEFIHCFKGCVEITLIDKKITLNEGQSAILSPMNIHSYTTRDYSKTYLCIFSNKYIGDFYNEYNQLMPDNQCFYVDNIENIIDILKTSQNKYEIKSVLYKIISAYTKDNNFTIRKAKDSDVLVNMINYITNNFTKNISLNSLSNDLGYSYNYISSFFTKYFNESFSHIVNRYRIVYAQDLLATEQTIASISINCGYSSIRNFNRNFYEFTGMTPSQYKNHNPQKAKLTIK